MIDISSEINISTKFLKTIEKSKQNHFINKSYSQKTMEKLLQKYNSEIKSFSKILTAKIEDIKNSKMTKIKGIY